MLALAGRLLLVIVAVTPAAAWSSLALWHRGPTPELLRAGLSGLVALLALGGAFYLLVHRRWKPLALFGAAFLAVALWWSTIAPPASANFAADVARQATGRIEGDTLTVTNVRDFDWRSDEDFTERWATRTYDLKALRTLDLFLSYWAGPAMAHVIVSFGFEGGEQLAWSVEVKRLQGGSFSPIADLFKTDPLAIVAASERDIVRVRSNVRAEDVQIYRIDVYPETMRALLAQYVRDANALAVTPQFYNSLTTNCTTTVAGLVKAIGKPVPLDWRLIASGYLPEYLYENGALTTKVPLADLRRAAHIAERSKAADQSPDYSQAIRAGVPGP